MYIKVMLQSFHMEMQLEELLKIRIVNPLTCYKDSINQR